jgi:prophage regulatory protein
MPKRPLDQMRAMEALQKRRPHKENDAPSSPSAPLSISGPRGPPLRRVLRKAELPQFVGLRRSVIDEMVREGKFPRPVKLGARAVAWLADEVAEWQAARIAERDAELRDE